MRGKGERFMNPEKNGALSALLFPRESGVAHENRDMRDVTEMAILDRKSAVGGRRIRRFNPSSNHETQN